MHLILILSAFKLNLNRWIFDSVILSYYTAAAADLIMDRSLILWYWVITHAAAADLIMDRSLILWYWVITPQQQQELNNISLLIPCMIVYVTNNKEPWTLNLEYGQIFDSVILSYYTRSSSGAEYGQIFDSVILSYYTPQQQQQRSWIWTDLWFCDIELLHRSAAAAAELNMDRSLILWYWVITPSSSSGAGYGQIFDSVILSYYTAAAARAEYGQIFDSVILSYYTAAAAERSWIWTDLWFCDIDYYTAAAAAEELIWTDLWFCDIELLHRSSSGAEYGQIFDSVILTYYTAAAAAAELNIDRSLILWYWVITPQQQRSWIWTDLWFCDIELLHHTAAQRSWIWTDLWFCDIELLHRTHSSRELNMTDLWFCDIELLHPQQQQQRSWIWQIFDSVILSYYTAAAAAAELNMTDLWFCDIELLHRSSSSSGAEYDRSLILYWVITPQQQQQRSWIWTDLWFCILSYYTAAAAAAELNMDRSLILWYWVITPQQQQQRSWYGRVWSFLEVLTCCLCRCRFMSRWWSDTQRWRSSFSKISRNPSICCETSTESYLFINKLHNNSTQL